MNLIYTKTMDQALLAYIIEKANEIIQGKHYLGRTALQKIMYFLKVLNVPMDYQFEIYYYGPFCDKIIRDINALIGDDVIKDQSHNQLEYSNYAPSMNFEAIKKLYQMYEDKFKPYEEIIDNIVKSLAAWKPEHLEIISTLDYCYRWEKATGGEGRWRKRVLERFLKIKKDKFDRDLVEKGYDILENAKLVEP